MCRLLALIVLLSLTSAAQSGFETAKPQDSSELLQTLVTNSLHDIRALKDFVYQQRVSTKIQPPFGRDRYAEEISETIIADGQVFARKIKRNGVAVPAEADPSHHSNNEKTARFDAVALFGPNVPFENLAEYFRITHVEQTGDRLLLQLERNDRPGEIPHFRVRVEALRESQKIVRLEYELTRPTDQWVSKTITCKFADVQGHWLPKQIVLIAESPRRTVIEQRNEITYKAFRVNSRILTDTY